MLVVYSFGNREYIVAAMGLSSLQEISSVTRIVLGLFAIELLTLGVYFATMKLVLGDSGLLQLAFALSSQRRLVQVYVLSMTVIVFAMAGVHTGNDFTFEFKWLKD